MFPVRAATLALGTLTFAACSADSGTGPATEPPVTRSPDAAAINAMIQQLPDWTTNVPSPRPPVTRAPVYIEESYPGGDVIDYKCSLSGKNTVRTFPKLLAAGASFDNLYPGALVQGASIRSGKPALIAIPRAPITVQINLPIARQSIRVDDVNSVTMSQAVSDLQRAASSQFGTQDPVRSDMVFELAEATTFDQSMSSVGISLAYAAPFSAVGAGGNIEGSSRRSVRTHSVVVKFAQEMFTVRAADDLAPNASDFFAPNVRFSDVQALQSSGAIGASNLPLYVESVTYGRIMLFSLKSTNVESAEALKVAMEASGKAYKGAGSISQAQRQILSAATYKFVVFGGPQDAATAAIANLDWSRYFVPAPATTAVPIAFTVRTLKGRETVTIFDDILYDERGGCEEPLSYTLTTTLTRVERTSGFCLACSFTAEIRRPGGILPTIMRVGVFGPATGPMTFSDARTVTLAPGQSLNVCSFFDTGSHCAPYGYPGSVSASLNNMKQLDNNVQRTMTASVNALGAAAKFTYNMKKVANFR